MPAILRKSVSWPDNPGRYVPTQTSVRSHRILDWSRTPLTFVITFLWRSGNKISSTFWSFSDDAFAPKTVLWQNSPSWTIFFSTFFFDKDSVNFRVKSDSFYCYTQGHLSPFSYSFAKKGARLFRKQWKRRNENFFVQAKKFHNLWNWLYCNFTISYYHYHYSFLLN